jgi:hypothetical protein
MTHPFLRFLGGRWKIVALALGATLLLAAGLVALGNAAFSPPDGPPIAAFDVRSGEPFELRFAGNGGELSVWLDLECDDCSFPVDGSMHLSSNGRTIEAVEISAGSTKRGGWEGGTHSISGVGVLDSDAQPAGAAMLLSGVLTVHGGRDFFMHEVKADAPPPKVRLLRLTVTN